MIAVAQFTVVKVDLTKGKTTDKRLKIEGGHRRHLGEKKGWHHGSLVGLRQLRATIVDYDKKQGCK